MNSIESDILISFSKRYDKLRIEHGFGLLCIMATGGGQRLSQIGVVPGASNRLAGIYQPYNMTELLDFVAPVIVDAGLYENWRSVHAESAVLYLKALVSRHEPDRFFIASTAALETTRRRKGENVSYVAMRNKATGPVTLWKIFLAKFEEIEWRVRYDKDGKNPVQLAPDEIWENHFMQIDSETGQKTINERNLGYCRDLQDRKITYAVLSLILNDPYFIQLDHGDKIIQLDPITCEPIGIWAAGPEPTQPKIEGSQ